MARRRRRNISPSEATICLRLVDSGVVSIRWLERKAFMSSATYYRKLEHNGPPRKPPGRPRHLHFSQAQFVQELLQRRPDLYLDEIKDILGRTTGTHVSLATIHRTLTRRGISRKRAFKIAKEQIGQYDPKQLVFVDETSYDVRDSPPGPEGPPLLHLFNRGARLSCIAGLTLEGALAPWAVTGAFNEARFLSYLRYELLPSMRPYPLQRSVVVMDNVAFHKCDAVRRLIEGSGCKVEFLSPYSPDFNPIERAFSRVKAALRRRNSSPADANAFLDAMKRLPAQHCRSWFKLAGYV
ncbi:hypothetical protein V8E36_009058 [Tilletia maclaganii]